MTDENIITTSDGIKDTICASDVTTEKETVDGGLVDAYFTSGDISYAPAPHFDDTPDKIKRTRSVFSMTHLSLFVFIVVSQGAAILASVLMAIFLPSNKLVELSSDYAFTIILSNVCQYLLAFPIFILMTSKLVKKASPVEQKRMSFGGIMLALVIAESFMYSGAIVSNGIASFLEGIFGEIGDNALDSIVGETPVLLLFLTVCVLAPIVEELMFRKLMIDRLSIVGEGAAIIFSAVAFGFFHGNIYQIIYATAIGFVYGYVYCKTRKIHYTIILHSIANFLGSIVPLIIQPLMEKVESLADVNIEELTLNEQLELSLAGLVVSAYSLLLYGLMIGGIVAFILLLVKRKINLRKERDIVLSNGQIAEAGMLNIGFILTYIVVFLLIIVSLIPS